MSSSSAAAGARARTVLVTGSTDGIGLHTASQLARSGWRVLVHGRSPSRVEAARARVASAATEAGAPGPVALVADLAVKGEVERLAGEVREVCGEGEGGGLDVLLNNAGVFMEERKVVGGGVEMTFAVNVLAPFLLGRLLRDGLVEGGKIVNVSSISHMSAGGIDWEDLQMEKGFDPHRAYSMSKMLVLMLTYSQAGGERGGFREAGRMIDVVTLDPGTVNSKMLKTGWGEIGIPIDKADDELHIVTAPDVENGVYLVRRNPTRSAAVSYDKEARMQLWDTVEALVEKWGEKA